MNVGYQDFVVVEEKRRRRDIIWLFQPERLCYLGHNRLMKVCACNSPTRLTVPQWAGSFSSMHHGKRLDDRTEEGRWNEEAPPAAALRPATYTVNSDSDLSVPNAGVSWRPPTDLQCTSKDWITDGSMVAVSFLMVWYLITANTLWCLKGETNNKLGFVV